jgi:hypothetical protein
MLIDQADGKIIPKGQKNAQEEEAEQSFCHGSLAVMR